MRGYAKFKLSLSVFSAAAVSRPPHFAVAERSRTGEHATRADIPTGKSSNVPVQPCLQKHFRSRLRQITS